MPDQQQQFVGAWEKIVSSPCSAVYPDRIEFRSNGHYFGQKDPPGTFTTWDVGTFNVTGGTQIRISTANDAVIVCRFTIVGEVLTFVDPQGCEFSYRKMAQ